MRIERLYGHHGVGTFKVSVNAALTLLWPARLNDGVLYL